MAALHRLPPLERYDSGGQVPGAGDRGAIGRAAWCSMVLKTGFM